MNIPTAWALVPIKTRSKNPGTIVGKNWQAQASADPGQISEWRANNFGCNWGLLLGPKSGVIDVEYDSDEGQEILDTAVEACGVRTVSYKSAKSVHRLFRYDSRFDGQKAKVGIKGTEWRFGQDSAQSVIPPSIHETGGRYEWLPGLSPDDVEVAELPDAMWNLFLDLQRSANPPKAAPAQDTFRETTGDSLIDVARAHAESSYDWPSLLSAYGWTFCRTRGEAHDWYRPGKNSGSISGTVNFDNSGTLRVFSSSVSQLEPESSYDKFAFVCAMQYGNDPSKAAKAIIPEDIQKRRLTEWVQAKEASEPPVDLSGILAEAKPTKTAESPDNPDAVTIEQLRDLANSEEVEKIAKGPKRIPLPAEVFENAPGFIGDYYRFLMDHAENKLPEAFLSAGIAVLSMVVGRDYQFPFKQWNTRSNVYTLVLAPSGAGKDFARDVNERLIAAIDTGIMQGMLGTDDFASDAAILSDLHEYPKRLWQIDEFSKFLGGINNQRSGQHVTQIGTLLMKLFTSSGKTAYRAKGYADRSKNPILDRPHGVIYGTSTADDFWQSLTIQQVKDGLAGRILSFEDDYYVADVSESDQFQVDSDGCVVIDRTALIQDFPESLTGILRYWLDSAKSDEVQNIRIEPEAFRRLSDHQKAIRVKHPTDGAVQGVIWARAAEKTSKLAMLSAMSRGSLVITLSDVEWAVALVNAMTRRMGLRIEESVAENQQDANVKFVLSRIAESGALSRRDLTRRTQKINARDRAAIVQDLINSEQVRVVCVSRGKRLGQWFGVSYRAILEAVMCEPLQK